MQTALTIFLFLGSHAGVFAQVIELSKENSTCDLSLGWLPGSQDSGKCYKLIKGTHSSTCYTGGWGFNWFDAYECCYSQGGYVAEPQNAAETLVIDTYLTIDKDGDSSRKWWIGATDLHHYDGWIWMSGAPWSFENWNSTQPSQNEEDNCSIIICNDQFQWKSEKCNSEYNGAPHFVICEKLLG